MLFMVSAVSAADSEIQAISAHNSTDTVVSTANDDNLKMNDANEILAETDGGNFTALKNKITGASGTVTLENNYTWVDGDQQNVGTGGIYIYNSITLDGQGYTIDAKGQSSIFVAFSSVTFKNIIFKNAYSSSTGAAIYGNADGITIDNCTFIGNIAGDGAAFYSYANDDMGTISNSKFINNKATSGSIVYNYGYYGTIDNCIFINNVASKTVIETYQFLTLQNSIIVNNTANYLVTGEESTITANKNWFGNTMDNPDSIPKIYSSKSIDNWYVLDLSLNHDDGIASVSLNNLYETTGDFSKPEYTLPTIMLNVSAKNIDVDDSVILGNSGVATITYTPTDAYEVTISYNNIELTRDVKPTFALLKNKINSEGNEINLEQDYVYNYTKDGDLTNGIDFAKDVTIDGQGHIIDAKDSSNIFYFNDETNSYNLTLKNIIFANATRDNGAAVYFKGKKIEIINCTFINNKATSHGDALYVANAKEENKIFESKFVNNSGSNSAVYINLDSSNAKFNISNSIFINNTAQNIVKGNGNVVADYNWWGNNASNYNVRLTKTEGITVTNWLFLNITADEKNSIATISLNNLFENNAVYFYENYALPTFTLNVKKESLNINDEIVLDENGQSELECMLTNYTGYLTVSYFDFKTTKELNFVDDYSFTSLKKI